MPDITMCLGGDCPVKEDCVRYRAQSNNFRQSYFQKPPFDKDTKKCDHFWNIEDSPYQLRPLTSPTW